MSSVHANLHPLPQVLAKVFARHGNACLRREKNGDCADWYAEKDKPTLSLPSNPRLCGLSCQWFPAASPHSSELGPEQEAQSLCLANGLQWREERQGICFWASWSLLLLGVLGYCCGNRPSLRKQGIGSKVTMKKTQLLLERKVSLTSFSRNLSVILGLPHTTTQLEWIIILPFGGGGENSHKNQTFMSLACPFNYQAFFF